MIELRFMIILVVMFVLMMIGIIATIICAKRVIKYINRMNQWKHINEAEYKILLSDLTKEQELTHYLYKLLFDLISSYNEDTIKNKIQDLYAILICLHIEDPHKVEEVMEQIYHYNNSDTIVNTIREMIKHHTENDEDQTPIEQFNNFLEKYNNDKSVELDTCKITEDTINNIIKKDTSSDDTIIKMVAKIREAISLDVKIVHNIGNSISLDTSNIDTIEPIAPKEIDSKEEKEGE